MSPTIRQALFAYQQDIAFRYALSAKTDTLEGQTVTTAYWCVLAATILPLVWVVTAKVGGQDYDNAAPREFLDKQSGMRQRANWAQQDAFEALPGLAA